VVVGDLPADRALDLVEKHFAGIPAGPEPPSVRIVEAPQLGERRFKLRKPGETRYLMAAWRNPALVHPDNYALDVLSMILGHGRTSRLYRALVEGKLATEVDASNETARDPFLLIARATVAPASTLDQVERALYREVERLQTEPVSEEEIGRAKRQVEASFVYSKDSIRSLAQQLGYFETVATYQYLDSYLDRVRAVTPEMVQRVAREYLTEQTRTVGLYDPLPEGA
jgi:zinc protease